MPSTSVFILCRFERRQGDAACISVERASHPTQEAVGFIGRLGGREIFISWPARKEPVETSVAMLTRA